MTPIIQFQEVLKEHKIKAYIVPTADFHQSEYVSDYFKGRQYLCGFSGSAGVLVITQNDARLWTDGRYFIQAEKELKNSSVSLMKMGQPGVPTVLEYLKMILSKGDTLGLDGRTISTSEYLLYKESLDCNIDLGLDFVGSVWFTRPSLPFSMLYTLSEYFVGESTSSKLSKIRNKMKNQKCDTFILTALEDQAWLYNMRADDVTHTPVFLSYTIITEDDIILFIDENKLNDNVWDVLDELNCKVLPYDEVDEYTENMKGAVILLDPKKVNAKLYTNLEKKNIIKFSTNPTLLLKAIKNETELKNTRIAHEYDGAAVTRFMHYLKTNVKKEKISELSASDYLEGLRRQNESFIDLSFKTICAYQENAAMMHYSASNGLNSLLKNKGLLLVDSGGHYLEGTTDITRTFALGNPTYEEKKYYTIVLKSLIDLSDTIFLKGCTGQNLDIKARAPIWKELIDYKCGTGHGVGHILSVHEAPNGFRWQIVPERNDSSPLEIGMITTNEPGIYLEGKLGIRLENEMVCKFHAENNWGTFYSFETITYAPFDKELILVDLLDKGQIEWLNKYHKMVFEKLSKHLNEDEIKWLREYTSPIN